MTQVIKSRDANRASTATAGSTAAVNRVNWNIRDANSSEDVGKCPSTAGMLSMITTVPNVVL